MRKLGGAKSTKIRFCSYDGGNGEHNQEGLNFIIIDKKMKNSHQPSNFTFITKMG